MNARMRWVAELARRVFRVGRPRPTRGRRVDLGLKPPSLEGLERREVLSGVAVAPFASLPGRITGPGQPAHVGLKIAHGQVSSNRAAPIYVELTVQPAPGSSARPEILDVIGPTGMVYPVRKVPGGPFLFKMTAPAGNPKAYAVDVVGQDGRAGDFILNASLAGDVNTNGAVGASDIQRIKAAYGTRLGMFRYDPAADVNQDGRVGCVDLTLARKNLGAQASVVPVWTAPVRAAVAPKPVPAPLPNPAPRPVSTPVVSAPLVVVPVPAAPVMPLVYYAPVGTVPVYAQAVATPLVGQALPFAAAGYAAQQPVGLIPLYHYGPQGPVYGYSPSVPQTPLYAYGLPTNPAPLTTYGQPVVRGPIAAIPAVGTIGRTNTY